VRRTYGVAVCASPGCGRAALTVIGVGLVWVLVVVPYCPLRDTRQTRKLHAALARQTGSATLQVTIPNWGTLRLGRRPSRIGTARLCRYVPGRRNHRGQSRSLTDNM
jgi:hypothetical protein